MYNHVKVGTPSIRGMLIFNLLYQNDKTSVGSGDVCTNTFQFLSHDNRPACVSIFLISELVTDYDYHTNRPLYSLLKSRIRRFMIDLYTAVVELWKRKKNIK